MKTLGYGDYEELGSVRPEGAHADLARHKEILTLLDYVDELENYVSIIRTTEVDLVRERLNHVLQDARAALMEILFPNDSEHDFYDDEEMRVPRWAMAGGMAFVAVVIGALIGVRRHRRRRTAVHRKPV